MPTHNLTASEPIECLGILCRLEQPCVVKAVPEHSQGQGQVALHASVYLYILNLRITNMRLEVHSRENGDC